MPKMEMTPCECTVKDFECDYNYKNENGKCVLELNTISKEPECIDGVLSFTQGYRKKQNSGCMGGLERDLSPKTSFCIGIFLF